ncbi:phosphopantetheine-binding protein [Streptomyces sp. RB6PN25]|uniref:Phosphopantetheine-binding protein n=1 Tax=Streptomyces humicola TaxID=2953240 RepID=A0ABT1Q2Y0_9ACTN|nr:beta-ketoacyl synthase N-terminal-like domain-containing protein [Streptomyces humicola]MCQ4084288.1 phosphopantetheine-binding protein [Streptomyces humicola]
MKGVAVLGLDCRFPGAPDPDAFWELLAGGQRADGAHLEGADAFDHAFFGIDRAEAAAMDPQQRLLLQTVWRALEDAGVNPSALAGTDTGVYVGAMADDWSRIQLADGGTLTARTGTGAGRSMLANRLSYQLDLRGPSLTVDSACSSALVAVHLAAGALLSGECELAVACGVNLVLDNALDGFYRHAGLAAPDGRCKPFGAAADGIGRAEGVAAVVLCRTADAVLAGRPVQALLLGSAINQDGRSNGIVAPSRRAQREVMRAACRRAQVRPAQVNWIEAHGTGTPVGDLIETRALGDVYGEGRAEPCPVGSVKGNIGHAEGAAGLAGLIKAVLALRHRLVPQVLTGGPENPALDLAGHGLRLVRTPLPLPHGRRVIAGVSSFGMGGSNAHALLANAWADGVPQRRSTDDGRDAGVFTLTAPDAAALRRNLQAQADDLAARCNEPVAALCWSSNRVRTGLAHRIAMPATDTVRLVAALQDAARAAEPGTRRPPEPPVVAVVADERDGSAREVAARLAELGIGLGSGSVPDDGAGLVVRIGDASVAVPPSVPVVRIPLDGEPMDRALAEAAAQLYLHGVEVDWDALYPPEQRVHRRLTPQRFAAAPVTATVTAVAPAGAEGGLVDSVRETVARIIGTEPQGLHDDDRFYDDLGFDSVMFMELKYRLEERIPELGELSIPEMMSSLVTPATLTDYLRGQLGQLAGACA